MKHTLKFSWLVLKKFMLRINKCIILKLLVYPLFMYGNVHGKYEVPTDVFKMMCHLRIKPFLWKTPSALMLVSAWHFYFKYFRKLHYVTLKSSNNLDFWFLRQLSIWGFPISLAIIENCTTKLKTIYKSQSNFFKQISFSIPKTRKTRNQ